MSDENVADLMYCRFSKKICSIIDSTNKDRAYISTQYIGPIQRTRFANL